MARLALNPDPPAVQLHELLRERQPEPGALLLAGVVSPDLAELLEDRRLILGRDPDPRVADGDRDAVVGRCGNEADPAALRGELHRVGQEVQQDLLHLPLVHDDGPTRWSTLCVRVIPCRVARSRTRVRALSRAVGRWN